MIIERANQYPDHIWPEWLHPPSCSPLCWPSHAYILISVVTCFAECHDAFRHPSHGFFHGVWPRNTDERPMTCRRQCLVSHRCGQRSSFRLIKLRAGWASRLSNPKIGPLALGVGRCLGFDVLILNPVHIMGVSPSRVANCYWPASRRACLAGGGRDG